MAQIPDTVLKRYALKLFTWEHPRSKWDKANYRVTDMYLSSAKVLINNMLADPEVQALFAMEMDAQP